jgi:hypothetical protein
MTTRAIPNVEDLEEGYSQMYTDSYETSPISLVDERAIVDKTFTFHVWVAEKSRICTKTGCLTAGGLVLDEFGQRCGAWRVEPLERTAYTTFQQPGKWTQLVHLKDVNKVVILSLGVSVGEHMVAEMVVLRDDSTGRFYLQERNSAFQNIDGEIVMANFYGERTIWGST